MTPVAVDGRDPECFRCASGRHGQGWRLDSCNYVYLCLYLMRQQLPKSNNKRKKEKEKMACARHTPQSTKVVTETHTKKRRNEKEHGIDQEI